MYRRTSPLPNFAMISIDSFTDRISHLRLEVVGVILWPIVHEVLAAMALVEISGESNSITQYLH